MNEMNWNTLAAGPEDMGQAISHGPEETAGNLQQETPTAGLDSRAASSADLDLPRKRLIALVPKPIPSDFHFAQKIYNLAFPERMDVLYLGLAESADEDYSEERHLATLAAVTRDPRLNVDTRVMIGKDWIKCLKAVCRPGDIIVCHSEIQVKTGIVRKQPLFEKLIANGMASVCVIQGYCEKEKPAALKWMHLLAVWLGCALILAGFSVLEFRVDQQIKGIVAQIVLILLLMIEVGAIWIWNAIIG